jgi:hypothetical protein
MKLRLHAQTLRLRLSPQDVDAIVGGADLQQSIPIDPDSATLSWVISLSDVPTLQIRQVDNQLQFLIPRLDGIAWAADDSAVGLYAQQRAPDGSTLDIAIEKDWACVQPSAEEDESDTYPRPE